MFEFVYLTALYVYDHWLRLSCNLCSLLIESRRVILKWYWGACPSNMYLLSSNKQTRDLVSEEEMLHFLIYESEGNVATRIYMMLKRFNEMKQTNSEMKKASKLLCLTWIKADKSSVGFYTMCSFREIPFNKWVSISSYINILHYKILTLRSLYYALAH